jgi:putative Ca2+/H+ antiporter (TMEM165/GDT1 family)
LQAVAGVAGFVGLAVLGGIALTLAKGGPTALMAAIAKSGFSAAFALIFVSEIGDKVQP